MKRSIAVIATMDTKGLEAEFLAQKIRESGHTAILVDVSTYKGPQCVPDITSEEVASAGGKDFAELVQSDNKEEIMTTMGNGAAKMLIDYYRGGEIDGVLGIGGNQGTAIASIAMRAFPIGFPKYLISTVASGNIRPFVGHKDITVVFSVSDMVGGPNVVTRSVLSNALAALIGMVENGAPLNTHKGETTIAISALGNTEEAVQRAEKQLKEAGYQVVAFHASGAGGSAMEELIYEGVIDAVLDMTPHELTEEIVGAGAYVPVVPGRMTAAANKGIPMVAATGGMEYVCFGPKSSIPKEMLDRNIYMHNPYNANVMTTHSELKRIAEVMAERLNTGSRRTALLIPSKGWSQYGKKGSPFYDPEGTQLFINTVKEKLHSDIKIEVYEQHINDAAFVDRCVELLLEYLREE